VIEYKPEDAHRQFEAAFNAGDLEALLDLYTPDARLVTEPGHIVTGRAAIREALQGLFAIKGRMKVETIFAIQAGDIALCRARWELNGAAPDGQQVAMTGKTSEIVQRQPNGQWLYVIDDPHGSE